MSLFRRQNAKRNSTRHTPCFKRLRIESLEQKNLLAGDVAVSLAGGDLLI